MPQALNQTLAKANEVLSSIREHYKKYAVVAVAAYIGLAVVYKGFHNKVSGEVATSERLLSISGRNVYFPKTGERGNNGSGAGIPGNGTAAPPVSSEKNKGQAYIPPEATVEITPRDPSKKLEDVINVKVVDKFGLTLEPGLDLAVAPLALGVDLKWFYWQKLGTEVGVIHEFFISDKTSPTVGLSYRLDKYSLLKNTELKINYAPLLEIPLTLGLRVNF